MSFSINTREASGYMRMPPAARRPRPPFSADRPSASEKLNMVFGWERQVHA